MHGAVRHHHKVILVHAHTVLTTFFQGSDNFERHIAHTDGLADGILAVIKEILHDGLTYQADLGVFLHIFFSEVNACGNFVFPDFKVVRRATIHCPRPVFGAVHQLTSAIHHGADHSNVFGAFGYQLTIPDLERLHVARAHAHATSPLVGTHHHDEVGAHVRELVGRALLQSFAQVDHSDDGGNADYDTEHGKSGARLVAQQGFRRNPYEIQYIHINNRFLQAMPQGLQPPIWSSRTHHEGCDRRARISFYW